ncbi:C40 family peptidase [Breznakia pachnodae]|uniref:NlpC/P60 domain-containing protein n=1 Tax=Breznakia pachnodae TaxID=265178 RepID=A0ABU0E3U2_9FIRM|nr:C40 family peptidase [Breznakia pachnodae]MDQ0361496.1 hypothetical protein [Breznakia pachnodae]
MKRNKKILVLILCGLITCVVSYGLYCNYKKQAIINSISLTFDNTINEVEYGDSFDTKNLVTSINGKINNYPKLDTMKIGKQKLLFTVEKEGKSKTFAKTIEIKDTKKPEIIIKEDNPTIEVGSEYDVKSNIDVVKDPIDGDIEYISKEDLDKESELENKINYYTIYGVIDTNVANDYEITIIAVDRNGNKAESQFILTIKEKEVSNIDDNQSYIQGNEDINKVGGDTSVDSQVASKGSIQDVIDTAMAQAGKPYVAGGRGPDSFDCDGLVLYAFTQNGYSMPSTASIAGYSIGNDASLAQPGDILVTPNHVAIYIGNGFAIEAKNPQQGIRVNSYAPYFATDDPNMQGFQFIDIRRVR